MSVLSNGIPPREDIGNSLVVNGRTYADWESVWIQERWTESFSFFKFTANEAHVLPTNWQNLQFKPGDDCTITLGGTPVINGTIITRQMSTDATTHMVQLTGKSFGFWPYKSVALTEDGNFDGKSFEQNAQILLAPWGGYDKIGTIDNSPFPKEQYQKGMKIWDYLEGLARQKHVIMGVNRRGRPNFAGVHIGDVIGDCVEGVNIKAMQVTITCENLYQDINVDAQQQGGDETNGTDASEVTGHASSIAPKKSILVVPGEQPMNKPQADLRAYYEKLWTEATQITANVTMRGWYSNKGILWEAGKDATLSSPMAMINGVLKIKTATFTQDGNGGTETTLELVAPWGLNDNINVNVGAVDSGIPAGPSAPQPPQNTPVPTGSPVSTPPPPAAPVPVS